jgi:hypothetical protein
VDFSEAQHATVSRHLSALSGAAHAARFKNKPVALMEMNRARFLKATVELTTTLPNNTERAGHSVLPARGRSN